MKFRRKPIEVEAIQFVYNPNGLAALMAFAKEELSGFSKPRTATAKATATVAGRTVEEGNYVVLHNHDFFVMTAEAFERAYESLPATQEASPVATPAIVMAQATRVAKKEATPVRYKTIGDAAIAARERGDLYFTHHRPCSYGHQSQRYASTGACVTCAKLADKKLYRKKQKAKAKAARQATPAQGQQYGWPFPSSK